jgi:hypothetical protein
LNSFFSTLLRIALHLVLLAMGLLLGLSLLCAAAVLALVWGLQRLWARLSGRPVQAWVFRFQPRSSWQRYQQARQAWTAARQPAAGATGPAGPAAADADSPSLSSQGNWRGRRPGQRDDITDVEPK